MEPAASAALLLWTPALLLTLAVLNVLGRGGSAWKPIAAISAVLLLLSPVTVPSSDSTAAVLLLWEAILVTGPLLLGLVLIVFAGDVPIGRLSPAWGVVGSVLVITSAWMLVAWEPLFASPDAWNRYSTALLGGVVSACSTLAVLHLAFVPRRRSRTWPMLAAAFLAALLLLLRGVEGSLAIGMVPELAGLVLGACLSLLVVLSVVWAFERRLDEPAPLPPPSQEALARAAEIIAMRPRGVGSDE
jgi:hypothetical protein